MSASQRRSLYICRSSHSQRLTTFLNSNSTFSGKLHQPIHPKSESESEVTQSCLTLCDPMDCRSCLTLCDPMDWSLSGFSVHGIFMKVKSLSRVRLFATPWIVAYQASPSMGFSRQECWSGLPFPSLGDLPNPGIELGFPALLYRPSHQGSLSTPRTHLISSGQGSRNAYNRYGSDGWGAPSQSGLNRHPIMHHI